MAKKVVDQPKRYCDDCAHATWVTNDHRHLDLTGKPICLTCPNYPYYIVRGKIACSRWKQKSAFNR